MLPPLFAYPSRNRPHRVPSYPMPVTEQPVATYSHMAFDAKLAECISKTIPSLPRTKRQFSVHAESLVLDFRSSPFCIMHLLYHFFCACQPFFEFLCNFFYKKTESKNGTDLTNIVERIGLVAPSCLRELSAVRMQTNECCQPNERSVCKHSGFSKQKSPLVGSFLEGVRGNAFSLEKGSPAISQNYFFKFASRVASSS